MPNVRNNPQSPATSSTMLAEALATAPDTEAVWRLLRGWRKRREDLACVAAQSIRHWDQGLILFVMDEGYSRNIGNALVNPHWPRGWADDAVIEWAVGLLTGAVAKEVLSRASHGLLYLHQDGRFPIEHPAVTDLIQQLDGRTKMTVRQLVVADMLLGMEGLTLDMYSHIATCLLRGAIQTRAFFGGNYQERALLAKVLEHSHSSADWIQLFSEGVEPRMAASWNHFVRLSPRLRDMNVGIIRDGRPAVAPPRRP